MCPKTMVIVSYFWGIVSGSYPTAMFGEERDCGSTRKSPTLPHSMRIPVFVSKHHLLILVIVLRGHQRSPSLSQTSEHICMHEVVLEMSSV